MKADTEARVLKVLKAGPLPSGQISERSQLTTNGVLGVLHRLERAKRVRRWGVHQRTRWALASWKPGPETPADFQEEPSVRQLPYRPMPPVVPSTSWWLDVPREAWVATIEGQLTRMQGARGLGPRTTSDFTYWPGNRERALAGLMKAS